MDKIFSDNLINLAKLVKETNHTLYVVGGATRNMLMGLPITDIDICSDIPLTDMLTICKNLKYHMTQVNEKYGSVKIKISDSEIYEFTTFRIDKYDGSGMHMPTNVEYTDSIDIDSDRRDFDINCIYYDILGDTYYDKYNGKKAIQNRCISSLSTPSPVLSNDGVRILRLIRISSELNFKINTTTLKDAKKYVHLLKNITPERRLMELKNIATSDTRYPTISKVNFLELFNSLNIYEYLINKTAKDIKIRLNANSVKNYFKLQDTSRFVGLCILLLEATLKYQYHKENLILYVTNTLYGLDGLKCSNEELSTINKIYVLYQDLEYGKKKNIDLIMATKYATLSNGEKDILSNLVSPDKYRLVQKSIQYLKDNNLPTNLVGLNITPTDLIEQGIKKEFVSKLMDILFKHCLLQEIKNEYEDLLTYAKTLNKEMLEILEEAEKQSKSN